MRGAFPLERIYQCQADNKAAAKAAGHKKQDRKKE